MKNLYAVSDKQGNPASFGYYNRSSWTSLHWVKYHLTKRRRNDNRYEGYHVNIIDLASGTIIKMSIPGFLSRFQNPEILKAEIQHAMGFATDLVSLESLVNAKVLSTESQIAAERFLKSRGITV
jgi:hypothetical protein